MKHLINLLLGCLLSSHVFAQEYPWVLTASIGQSNYPFMMKQDGQSAIGRLSLGKEFFSLGSSQFGAEIGLQSGNRMRLSIPETTLNMLGGVPIEVEVKPVMDVLITGSITPFSKIPVYALLKGGIAYRHLQVDRESVNDLSMISPEIQAGLGFNINNHLNISLMYQHFFGGNPNFRADEITLNGQITNIPAQNAILLGFSIIL